MSQQVTVDYEGLTIKIQAECDTAIHSLCKIDKTIDKIHKTASKLESAKVVEYENYLLESKETIQKKIEEFKATLEQYQALKKFATNNHDSRYADYLRVREQLERQSADLTRTVNELTGSKLAMIDEMIDEGLLDAGNNLLAKSQGVLQFSQQIMDKINQIDDISLRELAYRELLKEENQGLSFDEVLSKAQEEYDVLLGKKTRAVIEEYKEDLRNSGVDEEVLESVTTIDEATSVANESITDEKIRKETLKIIIKAIKARGFIVDTKKNLKIDKERNVVKLVALKASGQMAEFEIQLNGKFMYHFDEYEGQACRKDIEPFLEDLKNIYDINILHEEVQWENPDKIQKMHYQHVDTNKNKK
jgi:hypothetical protein